MVEKRWLKRVLYYIPLTKRNKTDHTDYGIRNQKNRTNEVVPTVFYKQQREKVYCFYISRLLNYLFILFNQRLHIIISSNRVVQTTFAAFGILTEKLKST